MEISTTVQTALVQPSKTVLALREEAAKNPVFNAVAHIFAIRRRARQQVTIQRLQVAMTQEGFTFTRNQYENVIKFLASQNLGTLERNHKGRIRALKNIKVTLQSIGLAAIARKNTFDKFSVPNRFIKLPVLKTDSTEMEAATVQPKPPKSPPPFTPTPENRARQYEAGMVVTVDGEEIRFELPKKVTMEQFFKILAGLYEAN